MADGFAVFDRIGIDDTTRDDSVCGGVSSLGGRGRNVVGCDEGEGLALWGDDRNVPGCSEGLSRGILLLGGVRVLLRGDHHGGSRGGSGRRLGGDGGCLDGRLVDVLLRGQRRHLALFDDVEG